MRYNRNTVEIHRNTIVFQSYFYEFLSYFCFFMFITLTDKNFSEEVLKSQKVVLVDFWAEWCFPCKMMEPILEEIKNEFGDKIKIGKLNVDENPLIASTFMIDAIPALILFKDGKIVQRFTGVQAKEILEEAIKKAINEGDQNNSVETQ